MMDPTLNQDVLSACTASGTSFEMLTTPGKQPAPTLLLFWSTAPDTLTTEPYCLVGRLLHAHGWNVVSLNMPCHGADRRVGEPEELSGWAARIGQDENIVASFRKQVNDVVAHLVAAGIADPDHIAAAGTSRGGFMAFHAAVGNPPIRAVAGFAPVTDLIALSEFAGQENNPLIRRLALAQSVEKLADRAAWIFIGNADERVDTGKAEAFAHALAAAGNADTLEGRITFRLLPVPGHVSFPEWHNEAAAWLQQHIVGAHL